MRKRLRKKAYGVLSDPVKRGQYDQVRQGGMASPGFNPTQGFNYSQQDIFRDAFTNQANLDELNRMFAQQGLRFDADFLNSTFFGANNVVFRVYNFGGSGAGSYSYSNKSAARPEQEATAGQEQKPNFIERWAAKTITKMNKFLLRKAFGIHLPDQPVNLDISQSFAISAAEAAAGGEKVYLHPSGLKTRKLMVKIPAGIQNGTRIRLKGLGKKEEGKSGDLYLVVKITTSLE